ncbi:hypothetical protein [Streptomyces sp. NPDC058254]|uniref:hypothetical protein n=1 Tax=Streptomyces sp. NPDC058254 TaxID=3346406 RepID=UPI0036ECDB3C
MTTTETTRPLPVHERRARVRQLADDGLSNRAIARQLDIGKDTVRRDLSATDAPAAQTPAPPTPTSGATPAPYLVRDLAPDLIQDLNMLISPRTGQLPAPLAHMIRAAADQRRAAWTQRRAEATSEDTALHL